MRYAVQDGAMFFIHICLNHLLMLGKTMKNALSNVGGWLNGFVGLLKTVIVFFVFAAIVWPVGLPNVVGGIVNLVNMFLGGGLAGLLALCVFCSFMD